MKSPSSFALVVALVLLGRASVQGQWVRWNVSQGGNGHWYMPVRSTQLIDWTTAKANAEKDGGYLATITSAEENTFVFGLASSPSYWNGEVGPALGGYQPIEATEPGGEWTWITGEAFSYSNWGPTQPDDGGGAEDALHFWGGFGGGPGPQWNDFPSNAPFFRSYIAERETEPLALLSIRVAQVEISWFAFPNKVYQLQYQSALTTNTWIPLGNPIVGTGAEYVTLDAAPRNEPQRYYRVFTP